MTSVSKTITLNNGVECPILGLGNNEDNLELAKMMTKEALKVGYRHVDTAAYYENERAVGQGLREALDENRIKRGDVFLTSKIFWGNHPKSNRRQKTVENVELALRNLGLDYIDLMLMHSPSNDPKVNSEVWSGLEEALDQRLVRAIGVSNFNVNQLSELLKTTKIVPQMNQIRSNPKQNNNEIIDYCKRFGIQVTAYSPLGSGSLIRDPTLTAIANRHNKTTAQVMIRWHLQRGVVAIPKSTKPERIRDNFNVWDFSLTEDDMKTINSMNSSPIRTVSIALIIISIVISWKLN